MAADYRFLVETTKLVETANKFDQSSKTWSSTFNQMLSLVNGMGSDWAGSGADTYKRRFAKHEQDKDDIVRIISKHVSNLKEIAQGYKTTDETVVSDAGSLPVDVVPNG